MHCASESKKIETAHLRAKYREKIMGCQQEEAQTVLVDEEMYRTPPRLKDMWAVISQSEVIRAGVLPARSMAGLPPLVPGA